MYFIIDIHFSKILFIVFQIFTCFMRGPAADKITFSISLNIRGNPYPVNGKSQKWIIQISAVALSKVVIIIKYIT